MIRKLVPYSIEDVLSNLVIDKKGKDIPKKILFDGDLIKPNSDRYILFKARGVKCITCGIEGKYFYKERSTFDESYHLNLYAVNDKNEEVLMTKDHVIPRSTGGRNNQSNYDPMCCICNEKKGSS